MNVWVIKEGEPLPIDGYIGRIMRSGIISEMLVERGHRVIWWTSDFFHQKKVRIQHKNPMVEVCSGYNIYLLHAKTIYSTNVSIKRIKYCKQLAKSFKKTSMNIDKPSIIICSFPIIELAYEAVKYAKKNSIPIIIDVRDFWPNIFWERFPKPICFFVKMLCINQIIKTKYIMKKADTVIGVIPKSLVFSKGYGRKLINDDKVYYLAYKERTFCKKEYEDASGFWSSLGLSNNDFIVCWIGQISLQRTDFCMVADVIIKYKNIKFVICGDGCSKEYLEKEYKEYNNIIFPGFLNQVYLESLMKISSIGVIPIKNSPDFMNTINNKAIEYMSGSLCLATTLKGLLKNTIQENNIGFYFEDSDDFEKHIIDLLNNIDKLKTYKNNARLYFEKHFRSEEVYGNLCDFIEKRAINKGD